MMAAAANVSRDTAARAKFISKHATEETKQQLREGKISINKAYLALKKQQRAAEYAAFVAYEQFLAEQEHGLADKP